MTNANDSFPADMVQALDEFDQRADAITNLFTASLDQERLPSLIYHYTNDAGLEGILRSGTLWLTDIFDLNDPSELRHGCSQLVRILKERAAEGPREAQVFAEALERFLLNGGIEASAHYFVCSFSKSGDELGQWRAYADNGRGFAIGFDSKALVGAFDAEDRARNLPNSSFAVTYSDDVLATLQRKLIDEAMPVISLPRGKELTPDEINTYMDALLVRVSADAMSQVILFKHEAYKNEAEYRFLQVFRGDQPVPEGHHRTRPYRLIRYREFNWQGPAANALWQIVTGPAADPIKGPKFARDCLRAYHPSLPPDEVIVRSTIPYRAE